MDNESYDANSNGFNNQRTIGSSNKSFNSSRLNTMLYREKSQSQRSRCEQDFGEELIGDGHDLQ